MALQFVVRNMSTVVRSRDWKESLIQHPGLMAEVMEASDPEEVTPDSMCDKVVLQCQILDCLLECKTLMISMEKGREKVSCGKLWTTIHHLWEW